MAQAYTPGLLVSPRTRYRTRRILPIAGDVLVSQGQTVRARDVVARTELPGDVTPINLARLLSLPAGDVPAAMLKQPGDAVAVGDELARTKGIFGFFKSTYAARTAGTIESVSEITGQVLIRGAPVPVEVRAFVSGQVTDVLPGEGCIVEAEAAQVQGIFGIGGEAFGPIRIACDSPTEPLTLERLREEHKGAIVVGGGRITGEAARRAMEIGAAAIVSGGIDDWDLREILGYDLGVAITGSEQIGLTLIITEGFGDIAMAQRTFELLRSHEGASASVMGATQIRAGVLRPEIVIPLEDATGDAPAPRPGGVLQPGSRVRIIRDPWFGALGRVESMPREPQVLPSGARARVLEVARDDGERVIVPRANVEIVSE